MKEIIIYEFQLEAIKEALRVVSMNYGCSDKKTCMDRMVTQAKKYAENALKGEKDKKVNYM